MTSSENRVPLADLAVRCGLWLALAAGLALKGVILLTHSITFDADEAVLGVMARHILTGERPLFFYGQSYMGALDAYLTVPFFLVFGQTVIAMRLLQVCLFAGVIATTYRLALRLDQDRSAALMALVLVAAPPVLFSLYTSSTLGNYVEILLFNNLLLLIGLDLVNGKRQVFGWWIAFGVIAGVGWWSMALIVTSLAPLAIVGLIRLWKSLPWRGLGVTVAGFALGAAPWIYTTLVHGAGATVSDLSGSWFSGPSALGDRLLSLFLFNLTALFGLRPPWSVEWILLPVGLIVVVVYGAVIWQNGRLIRQAVHAGEPQVLSALIVLGWLVLLILFLATPFGGDPTGRYLLPVYPGLALLTGSWLARLRRGEGSTPWPRAALAAWAIFALLVGYNLWGSVGAVLKNPPGLTKQFDPISQIPEDHDAELVRFLDSVGADRGYSNYWIAFRFAFLTGDRIVFSPRLPYKADLSYTYGDDRYPPYSQAVDAAPQVVYVISNPEQSPLAERLAQRLGELKVTFLRKDIGPYAVFYNLSRKVTPDDLGPFGKVTGAAIHTSN